MERQYQHTVPGQEVQQVDLALLAEAALADDRMFAELYRLLPYDSGAAKGILRPGFHQSGDEVLYPDIVTIGASAATIRVHPFRAVIGSRATGTDKTWLTDLRSGIWVGTGAQAPSDDIAITATSANDRWDLIYARVDVDVDEAGVTRYVKAADGSVAAQTISVAKATNVTVLRSEGTEAATPTKPSLPADGAGSYYIALAYIYVEHPFTTSNVVPRDFILTVAPVLQLSEFAGGRELAPANRSWQDGQAFGQDIDTSDSYPRPLSYTPPTMSGSVARFFGMAYPADIGYGRASTELETTTVVDDSVDWRRRFLKIHYAIGDLGLSGRTMWNHTGGDEQPALAKLAWCNNISTDYAVLYLDSDDGIASGSIVQLQVDYQTGSLKWVVNDVDPGKAIHVWIEATGQFFNATPDSST
jgi:hypothetical protein